MGEIGAIKWELGLKRGKIGATKVKVWASNGGELEGGELGLKVKIGAQKEGNWGYNGELGAWNWGNWGPIGMGTKVTEWKLELKWGKLGLKNKV